MDAWRKTVGLQQGIDNRTRWNSRYHAISKALKNKAQINEFFLENEAKIIHCRLDHKDWELLSRAHDFLETFAEATLYAEGKGSISQSILIIEVLFKEFEHEKVSRAILNF